MIFASKEYTYYSPNNWNEWVKAIDEDYIYCKNLPIIQYNEFEGKCKDIELPSYHPYWKVLIAIDSLETYQLLVKSKGIYTERLKLLEEKFKILEQLNPQLK